MDVGQELEGTGNDTLRNVLRLVGKTVYVCGSSIFLNYGDLIVYWLPPVFSLLLVQIQYPSVRLHG